MEQEISDSIQVLITDSIQDTIKQTDFLIGNLIPLEKAEKGFPFNILTTDHKLQEIYSLNRDAGLSVPVANLSSDTCFWLLSFSLVLFAFLSLYGKKGFTSGFTVLNFRNKYNSSAISSPDILSWPAIIRFIFSILNLGLFLTIAAITTGIISGFPGFSTIKTIAITGGIFAGILLFRHFFCIIIALFSGQKTLFVEYVEVIYSAWFVSSLVSFLLSAIVVFTSVNRPVIFIWSGFAAIGIMLLLRFIRLINIFINRRVSILYFILYLCALEVLPVLVVLKTLDVF